MTAPNDAATQVVSLFARQQKIYPRAVSGWFMKWRWALVVLTQLVFYGTPWLPWNGRQAVLFDLAERRFYIAGLVLYPQDFIYLTVLLILCAYALFLFTAVAGRLWCGYACPQTVYTEMFMWVERKIEGDRVAHMQRDKRAWTLDTLWRKAATQAVWLSIGLWTGFTFVGYFTPIHVLAGQAATLALGPWEWFWVLFYGLATYGNAGYMREQVCKYMCPYARFQSAMFDKDTLIISYDGQRGEPRGSRPRKAEPRALGVGDCIDCGLCVQVCPTGIDIRDGLQYACIGCAACVDVCDSVMDKMAYPRGLVRYATQNGLAAGMTRAQMWARVLRPRVLIYTAILVLITAAFGVSLALRSPFRVDVVRDRASLARLVAGGQVENVYRLQIMNATERVQHYRVRVNGLPQAEVDTGAVAGLSVESAQARWVTVRVRIPAQAAQQVGAGAHPMAFVVQRVEATTDAANDASTEAVSAAVTESSTFLVPR